MINGASPVGVLVTSDNNAANQTASLNVHAGLADVRLVQTSLPTRARLAPLG